MDELHLSLKRIGGTQMDNGSKKVHEVPFPKEGFSSDSAKKEWGIRVLEEYASGIGICDSQGVVDNISNTRLTGIKIAIDNGGRKTVYSIIEPKNPHLKKILICKEDDSNETNCGAKVFRSQKQHFQRIGLHNPEIIVRVSFDQKRGVPTIKPEHFDHDPYNDGKKSMRIFYVVRFAGKLEVGRRWKARLQGNPIISGKNKNGADIIRCNVELLKIVK